MSNKPDILAETISFARSNAEMSTYDREAWEAHARSCEAAMAERDRLREVNVALQKALRPFVSFLDIAEKLGGNTPKSGVMYSLHSGDGTANLTIEMLQAARAVLKRAEGGA